MKKKEETFNHFGRCVKVFPIVDQVSFASESDLWLYRVTIRRMDSVRALSIFSQSFLPALIGVGGTIGLSSLQCLRPNT